MLKTLEYRKKVEMPKRELSKLLEDLYDETIEIFQ